MRLALLSNVTVDLLASMLKKSADVYISAGYDTWQQEIIIPTSALYAYKPEMIILLLHANAYMDIWNDLGKGEQLIDEWCGVFKVLSTNLPSVPIFISSIDVSNEKCHYGSEVRLETHFENYLIQKVQDIRNEGIKAYILPVKDVIADIGRNNFYSAKMWYVGSMPYSMKGLSAIYEMVSCYINNLKGRRKKCLAIDLDNTLWGGVIGEDGVNGIVLANNKEGARFKDTQRLLKKMKNQGVMLAILSKNNLLDVEPVFSHPDMLLKHEDFVAEAIDWNSKCENIRKIAKELNIGLDAFVFLDDNPVEREQMMAECPEVAVIDFPKDSSLLPETIAKTYEKFFLAIDITSEDVNKTAMYKAENQRKAEMNSAVSVEDFLKNLGISIDIHYMTKEEEIRVTQLINKTNQFNLTTKRYSEEDIHNLGIADNCDVITIHTSDKFGEQGLVAVLIIKYLDSNNSHMSEAEIDTFLMSCRVMGRNIEYEILSRVKPLLIKKNINIIKASYIKTAKNAPVIELYEKLGFDVINTTEERKDYKILTNDLPMTTDIFKEVKCIL